MPEAILENRDIIYFAGEDWWDHNPHSSHHITEVLSKKNRILFINSIGIRIPDIRNKVSIKRLAGKIKSFLKFFRKVDNNIHIFTPLALPFADYFIKIIRAVNKFLLIVQILSIIKLLKFKRPVLLVSSPLAKDIILYLRDRVSDCLIYYCVDNISYYRNANQDAIFKLEIEMQKRADLVLYVNHKLAEERKKYNSNSFVISHGVDFDHFFPHKTKRTDTPADIKQIKKPIAGFVGRVESIDIELVKYAAEKNRGISFVFIGEVYDDLSPLRSYENIHFLGKKDYAVLPAYLQAFSCCCIFYNCNNKFDLYRNPKKLNEYLASGKPVISVNLLEVSYYKDNVYVARDHEEFNFYLHKAISEDTEEIRKKRIRFAKMHTWENVVSQINGHILKSRRVNDYGKNKRGCS